MPAEVNWYDMAFDLRERAARYVSVMQALAQSRKIESAPASVQTESSIFLWDALQAIRRRSTPDPGEWWWVFAPWLHALLKDGSESRAYMVCLGYHVGTTSNPSRTWLHFVPNGLTEDSPELHRLRWFVGYNVQYPDEASNHLLLTTRLLELIDDPSPAADEPSRSRLRPLLVSFDTAGSTAKPTAGQDSFGPVPSDRLLVGSRLVTSIHEEYGSNNVPSLRAVDWAELRQHALTRKRRDYLNKDTFTTALSAPTRIAYRDYKGIRLIDHAIQYSQMTKYFRDLALDANTFIGSETSKAEACILGPANNAAALADLKARFTGVDDYLLNLCSYSLWIHDVASHEAWKYVFTIPLWLPPVYEHARDGSAIVYLRGGPPRPVTGGSQTTWLLGLADAAQAGGAFLAHDTALDLGADRDAIAQQLDERLQRIRAFVRSSSDSCAGYIIVYRDAKPAHNAAYLAIKASSPSPLSEPLQLPSLGEAGQGSPIPEYLVKILELSRRELSPDEICSSYLKPPGNGMPEAENDEEECDNEQPDHQFTERDEQRKPSAGNAPKDWQLAAKATKDALSNLVEHALAVGNNPQLICRQSTSSLGTTVAGKLIDYIFDVNVRANAGMCPEGKKATPETKNAWKNRRSTLNEMITGVELAEAMRTLTTERALEILRSCNLTSRPKASQLGKVIAAHCRAPGDRTKTKVQQSLTGLSGYVSNYLRQRGDRFQERKNERKAHYTEWLRYRKVLKAHKDENGRTDSRVEWLLNHLKRPRLRFPRAETPICVDHRASYGLGEEQAELLIVKRYDELGP